jgi:hypothetical protein
VRRPRSILVLAALLLSAACTRFENGVVERPLPNDDRLLGDWQGVGEQGYLSVSAASPTQLRATAFDSNPCERADHALVTRTTIGRRNYLDVLPLGEDAQNGTIVVAYEFDAKGRLVIHPPDTDAFARAVERSRLSGEVTRGIGTSVKVRSPTADLRKYLAAHPKLMRGKPAVLTRLGKDTVLSCDK